MTSSKELTKAADEVWNFYFRASTAAGIWFLAFVATLTLGQLNLNTPQVLMHLVLFMVSGVGAVVNVWMMGAAFQAIRTANREQSADRQMPRPGHPRTAGDDAIEGRQAALEQEVRDAVASDQAKA